MKAHSNNFKIQIKELGRELDNKITYSQNGTEIILTNEELNSVNPHYSANLLKSVMKQLDIDSNIDIPKKTIINYKFGLKIGSSYEYLNFGNYVVYESEYSEDTKSYRIICYDKMLYTMVDYDGLKHGDFPMTIKEYEKNLCLDLGLIFKDNNKVFANHDKILENDIYKDLGYKYRDIFDELSQVTASTICLDINDQLENRYISDTDDSINEEYFKDTNVIFKEKYGPINSIVLSRSAESDNVYLQDEVSVQQNGLCEIKIKDNQIMNFNNRDEFLPDILEKLNGLEFYLNDFQSIGIIYYDMCDKYTVQIAENTYSCVMLNDEINIMQGLEENILTEKPNESVTDYSKADKTDRRIDQAWLIVNKQEKKINALVSTTTEQEKQLTDLKNPTKEISGNNHLCLDNTLDSNALEYRIYGKCEQETRSGKNLVRLPKNVMTRNGVTYTPNADGTFNLEGTASESADAYFDVYVNLDDSGIDFGEKYTFLTNKTGYIFRAELYENTTWLYSFFNRDNTIPSVEQICTIPTMSNANRVRYQIRVPKGATINLTNIQIQVEKGDEVSSFEKPGAMPSCEYPSTVKALGIENEFDSNIVTETSSNGITIKLDEEKNIVLNGTATAQTEFSFLLTKPIDGCYSFSLNNPKSNNGVVVRINNSNNTSVISATLSSINVTRENNNVSGGAKFYIRIAKDTILDSFKIKPMLEKGGVAHSYVPFGKWLKIKVFGKNLFEQENGQINMDGTKSDTHYTVRSRDYIDCTKIKTFAFSKKTPIAGTNLNGMCRCYDENKKFLSSILGLASNETERIVTMPENVKYFKFVQFGSESEDPQNFDYEIQIENGNEATNYESFKCNEIGYNLEDNELCSINDSKDCLDIVTGNLIKKIQKIILNGQENWTYTPAINGVNRFSYNLNNAKANSFIMSNYFLGSFNGSEYNKYNQGYVGSNGELLLCYNASTIDEFKTFLEQKYDEGNPIVVYYVLKEEEHIILENTQINLYELINHIELVEDMQTETYIRYLKKTAFSEAFYTKSEAQAEFEILNNSITNKVSEVNTSINNGLLETNERFNDYALTENVTQQINSVENKITSSEEKITIINETLENGISQVRTEKGYTFNDQGLLIDDNNSKAKNLLNEVGMTITDKSTNSVLLFAGYDEETQESIVKSKNMTVEKYLVVPNCRFEGYQNPNYGKGTGVFDL